MEKFITGLLGLAVADMLLSTLMLVIAAGPEAPMTIWSFYGFAIGGGIFAIAGVFMKSMSTFTGALIFAAYALACANGGATL